MVLEHPLERVRKRGRIARAAEDSVACVDALRHPADGRGDDGQTARHRLAENDRERLPLARHHREGCSPEERHHAGPIQLAAKDEPVAQFERPRAGGDHRAQGATAGDLDPELGPAPAEDRCRLDEVSDALDGLQGGHDRNPWPCEGRAPSRGDEEVSVDRVRNHPEAAGPAAFLKRRTKALADRADEVGRGERAARDQGGCAVDALAREAGEVLGDDHRPPKEPARDDGREPGAELVGMQEVRIEARVPQPTHGRGDCPEIDHRPGRRRRTVADPQRPQRPVHLLLEVRQPGPDTTVREVQHDDLVTGGDRQRLLAHETTCSIAGMTGIPVADHEDPQGGHDTAICHTAPPMSRDGASYWERRHESYDSLDAVGWTGLGTAFNGWMYAVRRRVFKRVVSANLAIGPETHVLDVGSGTGFYLDVWRELGAGMIEGSDLTAAATERLRAARPGVPVHRFDLGGDPSQLPSGPFDAVSAMDMLFHIMDAKAYARAVSNLAALVAPGGHVVLSENLLDGRVAAGPVQVSRSEEEITGLLRANGLEPLTRVPMFVLLNGPVDSNSRLLRLWWDGLTRVVSFHETLGRVAGAALFGVELLALRLTRRGPSTKLLICRRAFEA